MKTNMDVRSLGEKESNYTNSSVRNTKYDKSSEKSGNGGKIAASLLAGAGVGVLAGMLLAPKTGKDMRRQVSDSASKLGTQATNLYNTSRDKVGSWTNKENKSDFRNSSNQGTRSNSNQGRDIANDPATSITM
jgi:gas vesicle protein